MDKLIFFGSDQYSAVTLTSLLNTNLFASVVVITDRPKPVKNGATLEPSSIEKLAFKHNLKVDYYPTNDEEMINFLSKLGNTHLTSSTIGLCASFDHLIPATIIDLFNGNLYNLHPSLLPQYRNVSPVQYAIAMGETATGITLFRISTGIDNGQIIVQAEEPISEEDTTKTLTPRLFKLGSHLVVNAVQTNFKSSTAPPTYKRLIFTKRLKRESGFISWPTLKPLLTDHEIPNSPDLNPLLALRLDYRPGSPKSMLQDLIRALSPWPSVWSLVPTHKGELRIVLESALPDIKIKIAGKPKSISYTDFAKYYL
jgi:methionyl-tRNA formyltransferase